jgi:predicted protein tyrosine phosphatase
MIHVCSLARMPETFRAIGAARMVTLLNEGTPLERPAGLAASDHLIVSMNDIVEEAEGLVPPGRSHVETLLAFARDWDRSRPMLIHCYAGVSRSTAAACIVAAALNPRRDEMELARTIRRLSPTATPNALMIALADDHLGRQGRLIGAIQSIGRGEETFEGVPFRLDLDL